MTGRTTTGGVAAAILRPSAALCLIAAACAPAAAQSGPLDRYDFKNSPYDYENSPDNFTNSRYNYDNSPYNPASNGVYDPTGDRLGYAVRRSDGGLNIFADDGARLGTVPAPAADDDAPSTCLFCEPDGW